MPLGHISSVFVWFCLLIAGLQTLSLISPPGFCCCEEEADYTGWVKKVSCYTVIDILKAR